MLYAIKRWLHDISDDDRSIRKNDLKNKALDSRDFDHWTEEEIFFWMVMEGWGDLACTDAELRLAAHLIAEGRERRPLNALDTACVVLMYFEREGLLS